MKEINLNLSKIKDGAIQEQFDLEMKKVLENIHDLNTEPEKKRQIIITLNFATNEDREVIDMSHSIKSKLASQMSIGTMLLTGKDVASGRIEVQELKSGVIGQGYVDVDTGQIKSDVGEVLDEPVRQIKESKIIDLQKTKKA